MRINFAARPLTDNLPFDINARHLGIPFQQPPVRLAGPRDRTAIQPAHTGQAPSRTRQQDFIGGLAALEMVLNDLGLVWPDGSVANEKSPPARSMSSKYAAG